MREGFHRPNAYLSGLAEGSREVDIRSQNVDFDMLQPYATRLYAYEREHCP